MPSETLSPACDRMSDQDISQDSSSVPGKGLLTTWSTKQRSDECVLVRAVHLFSERQGRSKYIDLHRPRSCHSSREQPFVKFPKKMTRSLVLVFKRAVESGGQWEVPHY